jgi:diguanylate cyclase (GGDEF)-like protein
MVIDSQQVLSFCRALLMHRSTAGICEALLRLARDLGGITFAAIYVSHGEAVELIASTGAKRVVRRIAITDCTALFTGEPVTHQACSHAAPKNAICIPIIGAAEIQGLLIAAGRISATTRILLHNLAGQAGLSLASLQRQLRLEGEARTDQLTGLCNRRHFERALSNSLPWAGKAENPTSLLFIDIDHFKRFNDTYGHDAGDEVLRHFGQLLRITIRPKDTAARWGGEEFALIVPKTGAAKAFLIAEELRSAFKELPVARRGQLSISIGVSEAPRCGATLPELVHAADEALYRAKATRDRTELSQSIIVLPPDGGSDDAVETAPN